jgi:yecA family protein
MSPEHTPAPADDLGPQPPDYDALELLLAPSALACSAAEAHGIYCGLLASGADAPRERWLAELLPTAAAAATDAAVAARRDALAALAAATDAALADTEQAFHPLLPADDRPLRQRATAVHGWARGLLYGLGIADLDQARLGPETREVFDDLMEITRMDLDDLDEGADNEAALAEVLEFLRVAALLLREQDTPARRD